MTKCAHEGPSRCPAGGRRAAPVGSRVTPVAAAAALVCAVACAPLPAEAREAAVATQIELSQIAHGRGGFGIDGIDAGDLTGYSVSSAGDVNGDGLDDLVIGAPAGNKAFVVFGRTETSRIQLSDVAAGIGGFVMNGGQHSYAYAGVSVAGGGDINGDGLADLVVLDEQMFSDTNTAYVVFGKTDTRPVDLDASLAQGRKGFVVRGLSEMYYTSHVAGVGDINGDGLDDLLLETTSYPYSGTGNDQGAAYVVFGKSDSNDVDVGNLGDGGFVIRSFAWYGIGHQLSAAGDINGDGLADLALSDTYVHEVYYDSRVWIVFGKTDTAPVDVAAVERGKGGFLIEGAREFTDGAGMSIAAAGDVNGDGLADVLVGAYYATRAAGGGYVVFGKTDGAKVDLDDVVAGHGGFLIAGEPGRRAGWSTAHAGDVNGDGLADLALSTYSWNGVARRSYVVFGKPDTTAVSLADVAAGKGGIAINGELATPNLTFNAISGAGDVNGDGLADLVVGDKYAGPKGAGRAYVIFGATAGAFSRSEVDQLGGDGDDTLTGTPLSNVLVGGRGDDTFVGKAGADVLQGGSGDDLFVVNASNIHALSAPFGQRGNGQHLSRVVGGSGNDTLQLSGAGIVLDLSKIANQGAGLPAGISRLASIETIRITGSGDNTLTFGVRDVQDLAGMNRINSLTQGALGWTNGTHAFAPKVRRHQLVVEGDAGDVVNLPSTPKGWVNAGTVFHDGVGYTVYDTGPLGPNPKFGRVEVIVANAITTNLPGAAAPPAP